MKNKFLADSDLLINHFEQLLGGNNPDICEKVINLIENNSFLNGIVIDSLDTEIFEEIIQSISKIKTGKNAGNDNIIIEMFIVGSNFFPPILKMLLISYLIGEFSQIF